jgi:uncharacterized damage-inducible protein DinB
VGSYVKLKLVNQILKIGRLNQGNELKCAVKLMVDVRRLLEYNQEVRHRYFDVLARLPWEELARNREASFHSLRNIFIHTVGAVDYWLDFLLNEKLRSQGKFDEYTSIGDVRGYMERVEVRMGRYLDLLTPDKLMVKYSTANDRGENVEVTAEDVLIHVFEEEVHHRGELIALLWQMGVEPPLMGWKYL